MEEKKTYDVLIRSRDQNIIPEIIQKAYFSISTSNNNERIKLKSGEYESIKTDIIHRNILLVKKKVKYFS